MREPFIGDMVNDAQDLHARQQMRTSRLRAARNIQLVRVVDFEMSFGSLVVFFLKAGLAAIPATVLLLVINLFVFGLVSGFIASN